MRKPIANCVFAFLALTLLAAPALAQDKKRGDQTKITRTDIDEGGGAIVNAYDAVRLLRYRWLNPPLGTQSSAGMMGGGAGATTLIIYVDDIRQPDVENSLRRVKATDIVEMRYLDQNRAVQEFGPGHEGGVISVTTVRKKQ